MSHLQRTSICDLRAVEFFLNWLRWSTSVQLLAVKLDIPRLPLVRPPSPLCSACHEIPNWKKWIQFLHRKDYSVTSSTKVCFLHFENKYIKFNDQRPRLIWHTNPVPTIHPPTTKPSLQSTPSAPRRPPTSRGELDDLEKFKELDKISSVDIIK